MKNTRSKKLKICDATVSPGEIANLAMPLPTQYTCAPMYMPIRVIHGKQAGPCVVIFSTINGHELNGIEIVNRLVDETNADEIAGTIIAIPVMNVYSLTHYPRPLPGGGKLSQCFPGKKNGSYGERLAHIFTQEILHHADVCIELHTGNLNHNILPQVYYNYDNIETRKLAAVFGAPVITDVTLEGNMLRQTTEDMGVPLIVYQAGEAMRFDEAAISCGISGVQNVMRKLQIISEPPKPVVKPIFSQEENWIASHAGGILHTETSLGQVIKKGETLGRISDPFGTGDSERIYSPRDGIIVGINTTPLVHEGLPMFKVASFINDKRAESIIEEWNDQQDEDHLS
ncbi:MAG: succinylglutamate desuccinylase/aspartoacylase family protein [Alphaproteobacteria bacterium]